ncbi:MAG: type II toxin-antitoxin system PemK/MazF family toxin [bacterium]|nr:type II toxin-antitoxin system PemK/MazF family toxin [bacterium]
MTSYSFGDVVLVPFPFTDQSGKKKRPAAVVSSSVLHDESLDLVIMAITTQVRASSSLEVTVKDWQGAGLLKPSVVKPVFATIERRLVIKKLGSLQPSDFKSLIQTLGQSLGN